ncbi:MAG TPA: DUF5317 family protein [Jiangellaceae bacterium]|nr:DUF5317 family protein [Jiangellaceae bacterium]
MVLVLLALAVGVVVGRVRGGRLRDLGAVPPERNRLLITALGLFVIGVLLAGEWPAMLPICAALSWLVVAYYGWVNRRFQGALLVSLGLAANALVLLVNGAIPVSLDAADAAGLDAEAALTAELTVGAGTDTALGWLGRSVPVAFPPRPEVVSPGDVALAAGLATLLATAMVRPGRATMDADAAQAEITEPQLGS